MSAERRVPSINIEVTTHASRRPPAVSAGRCTELAGMLTAGDRTGKKGSLATTILPVLAAAKSTACGRGLVNAARVSRSPVATGTLANADALAIDRKAIAASATVRIPPAATTTM